MNFEERLEFEVCLAEAKSVLHGAVKGLKNDPARPASVDAPESIQTQSRPSTSSFPLPHEAETLAHGAPF